MEAADGLAGSKILLSEKIDLVICDIEMPGLAGDKVANLAQQLGVPCIILTSVLDAKRRAAFFRLGARDLITKPVGREELQARVRAQLEVLRLHRELLDKNEKLEHLSTSDALTGLFNRRHLMQVLELENQRAGRHGTPLSVVIADIDHFKAVNDAHGHPAGDTVLKEVAQRLRRGVRATDTLGRYGGEEFMFILASPADGALLAEERWRAGVNASEFVLHGDVRLRVTISVGIASRDGARTSPEALVAAADAALYAAKNAGRNRVKAALHAAGGSGPTAPDRRAEVEIQNAESA
jgi:diguanylate cyclase (GGDEF)-like protein